MSNVGTAILGIASTDGKSNVGIRGTDGNDVGAGNDGSSMLGSAVISIVGSAVRGRSIGGIAIDGTANDAPTDGGGVGNLVKVYVGKGEARIRVDIGGIDGSTKPNCRPRRACPEAMVPNDNRTVSIILFYN
jgi:hypothetical protein